MLKENDIFYAVSETWLGYKLNMSKKFLKMSICLFCPFTLCDLPSVHSSSPSGSSVFVRLYQCCFRANQAGIFFSYKHQVDEVLDDDQLSLPYQTPFAKTEADAMVVDNFVHSTQFDHQANHSSAVLPHHSHTTNSPQPSINSDYYHISTWKKQPACLYWDCLHLSTAQVLMKQSHLFTDPVGIL